MLCGFAPRERDPLRIRKHRRGSRGVLDDENREVVACRVSADQSVVEGLDDLVRVEVWGDRAEVRHYFVYSCLKRSVSSLNQAVGVHHELSTGREPRCTGLTEKV